MAKYIITEQQRLTLGEDELMKKGIKQIGTGVKQIGQAVLEPLTPKWVKDLWQFKKERAKRKQL